MENSNRKFKNVPEYLAEFQGQTLEKMEYLRQLILKTAPDAEEVISYNMPAYKWNGILVYFAGYKNHIGFYPTGSGITAFEKELESYKYSKGAVQFPLNKPIPDDLVIKMLKFRMEQNGLKVKSK